MGASDLPQAIQRLTAVAGAWTEQVDMPGIPPGRMTFEWACGGAYLLQRSTIPSPEFPDSVAIIAAAENGTDYVQHYFDSRGVVRRYAMTRDQHRWTLLRDRPDSSPLHFSQRFTGSFIDPDTIAARWERSENGQQWTTDFDLTYTRNTEPEEGTP